MDQARALDLVKLLPLMQRTTGRPEIVIGLIDGPIAMAHPELATQNIREAPSQLAAACFATGSTACRHGTLVTGILHAKRGSPAPAICPDCTLLVRPIFPETTSGNETLLYATPDELASAIAVCVDAGARVLNMSVGLTHASGKSERRLNQVLDYAANRGVIVIVASGNQGTVGGSVLTSHPWVIPVIACDSQRRPLDQTNLGASIGRRGLSAPGDDITSLGADGNFRSFGGTSAATPFVTGAIALLWSEFPEARPADLKLALTHVSGARRATVVPPLVDAWGAYKILSKTTGRNDVDRSAAI